jgi:hypothetical protein
VSLIKRENDEKAGYWCAAVSDSSELIAAYADAHPELGIKDAAHAVWIVKVGIEIRPVDDQSGQFTMTDEGGNVLVRLDLRGWMGRRE